MENSLKQRIVGAIVLIALAVIFLPSILKEKNEQKPFFSQIPAKPISLMESEVSSQVTDQNKRTQQALDKLEGSQHKKRGDKALTAVEPADFIDKTASGESKPEVTVKETAKDHNEIVVVNKSQKQSQTIGKEFKDAAWVIQIASFSNQNNAVGFVDKLKKAGHKAYRRSVDKPQGKAVHRIFVGPYIEKVRAKKALSEINRLSASEGILLPFDPTKH